MTRLPTQPPPPTQPLTPAQPPTSPRYAGFVTRLIACLIDLAILAVIVLLLAAAAQAIGALLTLYGVLFSKPAQEVGPVRIAIALLGLLAVIVYPVAFWVLAGQTPGKALMGLRVVRLDQKPMTIGRALARYGGYWLAALPLFVGFLWILYDQRRQGWHDKLAGTCVLYSADT
jgi:uncharacterized RDD family membrane protein YckC